MIKGKLITNKQTIRPSVRFTQSKLRLFRILRFSSFSFIIKIRKRRELFFKSKKKATNEVRFQTHTLNMMHLTLFAQVNLPK